LNDVTNIERASDTTVGPRVARADVEIFDPPMCCPTGLCGPTLDETLLDMDEMVLELKTEGRTVMRYQMSSDPQAFLHNAEVMALVRERQMDALPITVVGGRVVKTGAYPTDPEVRAALNRGTDG
jgi:Arsenical resistance operon protein ArsD